MRPGSTRALGIFNTGECTLAENRSPNLVLENRHTGERLTLRRVKRGDEVWLELKGSLPPRSEGPPLHIHFEEHEEGRVTSGTFSAVVDGTESRPVRESPRCCHAVRHIAGGTPATTRSSSKAMYARLWISTDFCRQSSRS